MAATDGALSVAFSLEHRYRVPALLAVGLEGFWGLVISAIALPILGAVRGPDGLPLDSVTQAFQVCSQDPICSCYPDPLIHDLLLQVLLSIA